MFRKNTVIGWLLLSLYIVSVKAFLVPDTLPMQVAVLALVAGCSIAALAAIFKSANSGEKDMKSGTMTFSEHNEPHVVTSIKDSDMKTHTLVLGTTRRGRSSLIEADAARRGLSYGEAEKDWMPTEAERQAEVEREKAAQAKKDARTAAVRDAYWAATNLAEGEFASLYDVLAAECGREPTDDHVRRLYNMLPADVIGDGVKWGFTDTVVGDSIFVFVRENKADVMSQVFSEQ